MVSLDLFVDLLLNIYAKHVRLLLLYCDIFCDLFFICLFIGLLFDLMIIDSKT